MNSDSITHGASRHLRDFFDEDTSRLVSILCLPLVDGVFATMLVSGSLSTASRMLSVSLTIFAGAGALAVVFSMNGCAAEVRRKVSKASAVLILGAAGVAILAPVYGSLVSQQVMRKVAAIVLIVIGGKLAGIKYVEDLPVYVVLGTGMLLALRQPQGISITLEYLNKALITAFLSSAVLFTSTYVRGSLINLSLIKKGAAAVLVIISASLLGLPVPSNSGLYVLSVSLLASVNLSQLRKFYLKKDILHNGSHP
ncbi:MAG: hypothetical protein J07AB43_04610 [Candidatus Nanosalina sp. J07AB43]|nr:MAG: hypothetical protein J07AB43_04610 [Candidatus Nanosalina sp. J07AB43]